MQLTRLNVLVVLGVVTIAGGAMFGTGAFTTVEADRTVDLDSSGDSAALVQFQDNGSQLVDLEGGDDNDLFRIQEQNLNKNATTTADYAFNVTNDGNDDVGLYVDDSNAVAEFDIRIAGTETSIVGADSAVDLDSGTTVELAVYVDLTGTNDVSNVPGEITFVADTSAHSTA